MIKKVLNTVTKYNMIEQNDKIVLGLSGGADSVSLLYILINFKKTFNIEIYAVHINHGIRGEESEGDQHFVNELCKNFNIEIFNYNYDVKKEATDLLLTEEEAGRHLRYLAFNEVADLKYATKIAVAHNKNDQAETILMRLIRGTGVKGLGGISPVRSNIIRPLIECEREEIETYCNGNNILFRNDSTNNLSIYTRNKIRLELLINLKQQFNPNIIDNLSKTAEQISLENDYMEIAALEAYNNCAEGIEGIILNITELSKYHDAIKRRIIRIAYLNLANKLKDLSYENIKSVLDLINKETGKQINLPGGVKAEKSYNKIIFSIYSEENEEQFSSKLSFGELIYIKEIKKYISMSYEKLEYKNYNNTCTKKINYDKIKNGLVIRNRQNGDRIYFKSIGGNKKIKDFFIDKKVPRDERDKILFIADGENILLMALNPLVFSDYFTLENDDSESKNKKIVLQIWEDI